MRLIFVILTFLIVIIVIELVIFFWPKSVSQQNNLTNLSNTTSPNSSNELPGRFKENEYKLKYSNFIKDSRITLVFSGRISEITSTSITLINNNKTLTISDEDDTSSILYYSRNINSKSNLLKSLQFTNLNKGDSAEVSVSINDKIGLINIDAIFKTNE